LGNTLLLLAALFLALCAAQENMRIFKVKLTANPVMWGPMVLALVKLRAHKHLPVSIQTQLAQSRLLIVWQVPLLHKVAKAAVLARLVPTLMLELDLVQHVNRGNGVIRLRALLAISAKQGHI